MARYVELGNEILKTLDYIVPAVMVILAIILAGSIIKGYKRVVIDVKEITHSLPGVIFFIIILVGLLLLWIYVKGLIKL
ncbi:MAG: hypothetical protein RBQ91_02160 [Acholeplasma sp.]|nr:hypothetical protein [Acholeplasma sp.]